MRVRVGSADLYFEVFGQQRAVAADARSIELRPTVIALHGGPGVDGTKLRFLLPPLADIAQVVVPDQRGHGLSDYGCPAEWNLAQWAGDVKALADVLGIERPIVLGESFGGFVAQQYASSFPQHPAGVVLVSSGPRWVREDEILARPDLNQAAEVAAAVTRRGDGDPAAEAWINRVEPLLRTRSSKLVELVNALRIRTMEVNGHFEAEGVRMDLAPGLSNVRCPVLAVIGERDILTPRHIAEELLDALPSGLGRLEVVPDASHDVLTDNPAVAWSTIREFIAQLRRARPGPAAPGRETARL